MSTFPSHQRAAATTRRGLGAAAREQQHESRRQPSSRGASRGGSGDGWVCSFQTPGRSASANFVSMCPRAQQSATMIASDRVVWFAHGRLVVICGLRM